MEEITSVYWMIILKCILENQCGWVQAEFDWFGIKFGESSGSLDSG